MDDYIRREAAKAQIRKAYTRIEDRVAINCVLNDVPAADVAPVRHGRWIDMGDFISCSVCTATRMKEFLSDYGIVERIDARTNYCPYCGAKLDGGADDE